MKPVISILLTVVIAVAISLLYLYQKPSEITLPPDPQAETKHQAHSEVSEKALSTTDTEDSLAAYATAAPSPDSIPDYIKDTQIDGRLKANEQGELIIEVGNRRLFDYFLSLIGRESLATIKQRVALLIQSTLPSPAKEQAWQLFNNYLSYKTALGTLPEHDGSIVGMQTSLKQVHDLQSAHFRPEVTAAFFGNERAYDEYMLQRFNVLHNQELSDEQKHAQLEQLQLTVHPELKRIVEASNVPAQLQKQVETMRKSQASPEAIRALREQTVGIEAANRLEALDQRRAEWESRYTHYRQQYTAILEQSYSADEQNREIRLLREQLFNSTEQRRVEALDRINHTHN